MIHTGAVLGVPHLKLIPEGGPQCSAMLTSEEPSVRLGTETEVHPDDAGHAGVAGPGAKLLTFVSWATAYGVQNFPQHCQEERNRSRRVTVVGFSWFALWR